MPATEYTPRPPWVDGPDRIGRRRFIIRCRRCGAEDVCDDTEGKMATPARVLADWADEFRAKHRECSLSVRGRTLPRGRA